jgi:hypothetical protein
MSYDTIIPHDGVGDNFKPLKFVFFKEEFISSQQLLVGIESERR